MTGRDRPVCDHPEPCGRYAVRYAAGKDKADFEVLASLDVLPHVAGALSGEAGLPTEGHDPAGQDVARAIRPGGGLGHDD